MKDNPSNAPSRKIWLWVIGGYLFQSIPAAVRDEALPVALKNIGYGDAMITRSVAPLGLIFGFKILLAPVVAAFRRHGGEQDFKAKDEPEQGDGTRDHLWL